MNDTGQLHNEPLIELLGTRDIQASAIDDWIQLPGGKRARAIVWNHPTDQPGIHMVKLDVVLELWVGRHVVESCGGYGTSPEEAISSALESFAQSSLNPMLVAFLHTDHEVIRDAWEIDDAMRAVTIGDVGVRGRPPGDLDLGWLRTFEQKIKATSLTQGTHWVRLYYAQQDEKTVAMEVLLDNEPWATMRAAMGKVSFPKGEGFFSTRVFLVIQGGIDISRAVARMIELPGKPDAEIGHVLAKDGADPRQVQSLLAYVPLAFGRVALQELPIKYSDTAVEKEGPDSEQKVNLMDQPIYAGAKELADRAWEHGLLTQDQFFAVALRSAEVHAINSAIQGGANAQDLVVSTPIVTLY